MPHAGTARGGKGATHVLAQTSGSTQAQGDRRRGEELARRVLVVEDDALICLDTADALEQQGFVVHTALSAEVALRGLREGLGVDILFTDINLPGAMDGTALARAARELLPELIVAYTSGAVQAVGNAVAGSAFVPKPYDPERVGRMLGAMRAPALVA
jgi:DNA-binding NtrC family response regulator